MDIQRVISHWFSDPTKTRVAAENPRLKAASTRQEAYKAYGNRDRDGKDDVLLRDRANSNYYVLSADRLDFTAVGVGNRLQVDGVLADVLEVNNETDQRHAARGAEGGVAMTRKEKSGWFSSRQAPVKTEKAQLHAITSREDRAALDHRVYRDGKDNLVIRDDNSRNQLLVTADRIDFTTVGVGDRVTVGKTTGTVQRIDDEGAR